MKHFYISLYDIPMTEHPVELMKKLGIWCFRAVPQSMYERWDFWCCQNVPDPVPEFLKELELPEGPGNGLSAQDFAIVKKMSEEYVAFIAMKDRLAHLEHGLHMSQDRAVGIEHAANEKLHAAELQLHSASEAMTGLRAEIADLKKVLSKEKQDREVAEREITELRTGARGPDLKAAVDLMDKLAYGKWDDMCEIARYSVMGQVIEAAVGPGPIRLAPLGAPPEGVAPGRGQR